MKGNITISSVKCNDEGGNRLVNIIIEDANRNKVADIYITPSELCFAVNEVPRRRCEINEIK